MPVWFSWFHPSNNIPTIYYTCPWKHLAPILPPLTEPIAVTLSSLGPGPLGTSPDCCLPGTYFLCPIPPSSHPKVPPPEGTGATLRTSTSMLGFVPACTADSISLLIFWLLMNLIMLKMTALRVCVCRSISLSGWMVAWREVWCTSTGVCVL